MDMLRNGDEMVNQLLMEFVGVCISNVKGWRMKKHYSLQGRENNHGYARTAKEFREQLAGYLGGTFADVTTRQKCNTYYKDFKIIEETKELSAKEYEYEETEFLAGQQSF